MMESDDECVSDVLFLEVYFSLSDYLLFVMASLYCVLKAEFLDNEKKSIYRS